MSWDSYITSMIGYSEGAIESGAIIGLDGTPWTNPAAASNVLAISPDEAKSLAGGMAAGGGNVEKYFAENGMHAGGVKFIFLRDLYNDGTIMCGKKNDQGTLTLGKTKKAVLVAKGKEGVSAGNINKGIEEMIKYLISVNY